MFWYLPSRRRWNVWRRVSPSAFQQNMNHQLPQLSVRLDSAFPISWGTPADPRHPPTAVVFIKLVWKSCVGKRACLQLHIPRHALWQLKLEWLCARGISRKRSLPDINEHIIKGSLLNIVLCSKAFMAGDYQRCLFVYRPSPGPELAVCSVNFSRCTWSLHSNALSSLICSTASIGVVQRWIIPQSRKCIVPYSVRNEMPLMQKCQLHICKNIHLCFFFVGLWSCEDWKWRFYQKTVAYICVCNFYTVAVGYQHHLWNSSFPLKYLLFWGWWVEGQVLELIPAVPRWETGIHSG